MYFLKDVNTTFKSYLKSLNLILNCKIVSPIILKNVLNKLQFFHRYRSLGYIYNHINNKGLGVPAGSERVKDVIRWLKNMLFFG